MDMPIAILVRDRRVYERNARLENCCQAQNHAEKVHRMFASIESLVVYPPVLTRQDNVNGRDHCHDSRDEYPIIAMVLVSR
jgi:hypothetical protein